MIAIVNTTFILGQPLTHPIRGVQLGMLVMGVCGLSSERTIVHKIIVGIAVILVMTFVLFNRLVWKVS